MNFFTVRETKREKTKQKKNSKTQMNNKSYANQRDKAMEKTSWRY